MSERRRSCAGAMLAVVLVVGACASDRSDNAVPSASTTIAVSPSSSTTTTAPTTTAPATTATSNTSTSSTSTSTTVACARLDMVVLGNSTDYWPNFVVGVDEPTEDAWPAVLETLLRDRLPDVDVAVENGSVLGAGFDIGLYGVTSMNEQLEQLAVAHRRGSTVLLLAPSVVDLQLRSLDVDASFEAFERLLTDATSAFSSVWVLPMNPVAVGADRGIARAVAAFNTRLVESGLLEASDASPLLSDDGLFGRSEFYDDFDDGRLDTPGPDPDGLHFDVDGHVRVAEAVADRVTGLLPTICS